MYEGCTGEMWATLGQDWGSCRENSKAETQFWEILKLGSEWQREAEMQNEAMGSPNFPNSYSQGSKNFCILQAPVTGPGPLSKLQSRRLYEKWSWVPQWNLSSACICFFTTIWSSFSPFSIALRKKKKHTNQFPSQILKSKTQWKLLEMIADAAMN